MQPASHYKISEEILNSFNKEETFKPPKILEEENYNKYPHILNYIDLLRPLVIHRPELAFYYIYLLNQEPFDEI